MGTAVASAEFFSGIILSYTVKVLPSSLLVITDFVCEGETEN